MIDILLIRALVLQMLSYASSSIGRAVKDAEWILGFFSDHHIYIENCRTAVVDLIIKELDRTADFSVMQKNSIMTTLGTMIELCEGFGLVAGTGIVDCSYRWKDTRFPKRATDACVIEQLDSYFFDPIIDIPLQYRTVYMLLRLISNRISEVLFMPIDCLIYPDIDTYSISIPTQKATPYHVPKYKQYPKKLSGIEEGLLHRCLCELQQYAESQQNHLPCQHQNLLFVSPTGNTIVTTSDVNDYFKDICVKYLIKDSSGNPAIITTHDLRHTAVVERFKYGVISPYQTMRESNHSSLSQTLGYKEFQPKNKDPLSKNMTLEEAMKRISSLEDELVHSRHNNRVLKEDNSRLRAERDNFELKYRTLLGQYQIDVGKKISRL